MSRKNSILFRYDSSTGTFTVPVGGDGFYYFSAYFVVYYYEYASFDIQINGEPLCTAYADRDHSPYEDEGPTSCSAATFAAEGKKPNKHPTGTLINFAFCEEIRQFCFAFTMVVYEKYLAA